MPGGIRFSTRQSHIHDEPPTIALCEQPFEFGEIRFAWQALHVHRGDLVVERTPGRPAAHTVEAEAFHFIQIAADELLRRTQCPVVADPEEKYGAAIERELR